MSSYYDPETRRVEWDGTVGDLDDRYYRAVTAPHKHAQFEDMLNCNECWLEEAAARREAAEADDAALARIEGSIYP